jgi:hypothetical protein
VDNVEPENSRSGRAAKTLDERNLHFVGVTDSEVFARVAMASVDRSRVGILSPVARGGIAVFLSVLVPAATQDRIGAFAVRQEDRRENLRLRLRTELRKNLMSRENRGVKRSSAEAIGLRGAGISPSGSWNCDNQVHAVPLSRGWRIRFRRGDR